MDIETRIATLQRLHQSPYRLHTSLETVHALDAHLALTYGIAEPLGAETVYERVATAAENNRDARRLLRAMEARDAAHSKGQRTEREDARFYEMMAKQPFLGWVHSRKRTYILDAAAALTALVETLNIHGGILDVGCHAGYHATWLAKHRGLSVTGIDPAASAIQVATQLTVTQARTARFEAVDFRGYRGAEPFELIYSIDGPFWLHRHDTMIAKFFDQYLLPGGLFVVVGEDGPPFDALTSIAQRYGLYPMLSDVIGGWHGSQFEGAPLLAFIKSDRELPVPEAFDKYDAAWDSGFAAYANRKETTWREKTQAFYRARRLGSSSLLQR